MSKEVIDKLSFIVVGAGKSLRFKSKKIFYMIDGKTPLLIFTLKNIMFAFEKKAELIFVHSKEDKKKIENLFKEFKIDNVKLVEGGEERPLSVINGLLAASNDTVFIHDCARPFLTKKFLLSVFETYKKDGKPLTPYVKPFDTVRVKENGKVKTLSRDDVMLIQTPQVLKKSLYLPILKKYLEKKIYLTDDVEYLLREGIEVNFVEGERKNIKVTDQNDINLVETIYKGWNK
ncbi:MAG: 2-C-methyl-D-erythritol 4-phosphate cytidylyltransferase [bacterium]|nr:2-C-methyl-D-erythritol 4-phosphate cytidylyltransferase [bacterium]